MIAARAVAIACLTVFGWLLWIFAGLLVIYLVMAWRSGDPGFKLVYLAVMALASVASGFASRHLARRIEAGR
ncbi:MAG: hypothetical protein Q8O26_17375 [Phreatobacter sp.]|uniref:hypothetical protein n=1 Tax=Phreatobacter sp. TaxID=1966341 RepID=UPI0027374586|nr:hypothetical protein [Phreatobacter sp.]MDP2803644.1 hypothetical protein [Phreatobacter sp.]